MALENHEYETSKELVWVVEKLSSPWIGLLFDFGNSMMAWEDPIEAVNNMAPYTFTTHAKDHIIIEDPEDVYKYVVCGVPIGEGNLDIKKIYDVIYNKSPLKRINIESCHPYCAQFKRAPGVGGVDKVGENAFKVHPHPYPYNEIKPLEYYYPHEISNEYLEKLLKDQDEGLKRSVKYLKEIRDSYLN
ncbi:sugar phosphate isomerase/epimerase family protein [Brachyspira hyodysenteriae]|uniref:sugar phosphate isomerase/epimerase family protein n=1 Tax=Brachyspira hyodysenteriae TaxID=159 RepID=UPI001EF9F7D6|nr:TIM barrel protein [Brachyspira hyodysenteriae]